MKINDSSSMVVLLWRAGGLALALILMLPMPSRAHGVAGKRFFPTTFQVEDPFVSDEFSILLNHIKEPEGQANEVEIEFAKRITPHFGVSVGDSFRHQDLVDGDSAKGLGNLDVGAKYQFLINEEHETILSFGTNVELGGTGARRVGADSFSTVSPALFFGKGLGDLPETARFLRPLAITGVVGPNFPTHRSNFTVNADTGETEIERNPTTLTWALSLQYSLMYLQSFVKDVGLGAPFNRMMLVAEFPMETCLSPECDGQTTGTVNPGVVWAGKYVEFGVAAQIPLNSRTGKDVGVLGLFHLFIDDLYPKGIGGPIFR
jgi:hypothetical protein